MTNKEFMMIKRDLQKRAKRLRGNPKSCSPFKRKILNKIKILWQGYRTSWAYKADKEDEEFERIAFGDPDKYTIPHLAHVFYILGKKGGLKEKDLTNFWKSDDIDSNPVRQGSCTEVYDDNWDDREMILVSEKTLKPACIGQRLKSFRGEYAILEGGRAPHKPSSTGRVFVKEEKSMTQREFFPGVYGLQWIPSVNVFPVDRVTQEPRYKLRANPACMRSLQANGGKTKTWKLGEYAAGGIIQVKMSGDGNAVAIRALDYYTKEPLAMSMFRWPLDRSAAEMYLNELTTSYYSNVILDWIASAAE